MVVACGESSALPGGDTVTLQVLVVSEGTLIRHCLVRSLNQFQDICAVPEQHPGPQERLVTTADVILHVTTGIECAAPASCLRPSGEALPILFVALDKREAAEPHEVALVAGAEQPRVGPDISLEALRAELHRCSGVHSRGRVATGVLERTLTTREHEVARLIVDGLSNKEIAVALNVSTFTVKNHVQNVLSKLNLSSRVALVARYARTTL